ncbi:E3 ubiquitin-protein ligase TRIP12, partial [Phenoliferia sp. Uapishka_3]
DADGSPLGESHLSDRAALEAAADAAGFSFGGAGGAASAFRSLHGMMSGMSSRLKGLLASLKSKDGDASAKLIALQDLAELLSVSTEDTLAGYFQVEAFVKEIIIILKGDPNVIEGGGGGGGAGAGMTPEECIAFGIDPSESGGGGGVDEESNVQMMLLACRCLANLMEALPGTAHSVVYAGAVPVLCAKLMEIQYIDLAEQTLSTLEKISEEVPSSIVREGGLSALLTYLDFFSFHVQRTAVTAAANCCRSLTIDSFDMVREVIPIFKNVLGYPDQRVVEQACLAVVRIVESYRHYPDKLESLLTPDLLTAIRNLLNPDSSTIGAGTYTQILKMLGTAAKASPQVATSQIELNIGNTLYHLLTGVAPAEFESDEGPQALPKRGEGDDLLIMQNLVQRPKEQIAETLGLVCELLPPLPKDGIFDPRAFTHRSDRSSRPSSAPQVKLEESTPDLGASLIASTSSTSLAPTEIDEPIVKMEVEDAPIASTSAAAAVRPVKPRDAAKEAALEKRLELFSSGGPKRALVVKRYYAMLLPTLVDVYSASVNTMVRTKAVLGLMKIINFGEAEDLAFILKGVSMASFLAAILSSRDQAPLVTNALQLVELLLIKMPDSYQYFFRREGVMHEIERIAAAPLVSTKSKRTSPSRTPRTSSSGTATPVVIPPPSGIARSLLMNAGGSADAPDPLLPPAKTILSSAEAQAQDAITLRARHLRDQYAAPDSDGALKAKTALEGIRELVKELDGVLVKANKTTASKAFELVKRVAALFSDERNPLSSFELQESGLVDGLLRFATETGSDALPTSQRQELLAKALMPQLDHGDSTPAFAVLVKRLQDSLSRMEQFEVTLAAPSSSDCEDLSYSFEFSEANDLSLADSRRNAPSMLARQLKLRLVAEDGTEVPRSCTNIVVSIHAIATFQAFNDYLRPRILAASTLAERASAASSAPAGGSLSSFLASFAAAAAGESPPESGEPSGSRLSRSLGAGSAAAGASAGTRRRSTRLSGKGAADAGDEASSSKATLDNPEVPASPDHPPILDPEDDDVEMYNEQDEEDARDAQEDEDDELFAADFDGSPPSRDDRTVHLEVADDKLIAKTPDGTRVGTPVPGKSATVPKPAAPKPRPSYAAAVKSEPTDFHLEFSIGGRTVDLDTTVYGAIHTFDANSAESRRNMWHAVYTVKFKKVPGAASTESERSSPEPSSRDEGMLKTLPASIPADSQQATILQLLWVLHTINSDYGDVRDGSVTTPAGLGEGAFVNNKLTAKLNRQLEEPMIVASACLPDWALDLPRCFPFLFPFDTRYTFLQSTAFGYARLMQKWVGQAKADSSRRDDNLGFLGRLQRQKVRISRDRMLESAYKVFELYGSSRAALEVEFFAEVGSGLGPTLEFYALVSKEFARKDLNLWRQGDTPSSATYIHQPQGLFPCPMDDATTEAGKKVLKVFRVLGQFVGKALTDSRIIDVHFSRSFMKLVLDYELPLTIASVKTVDRSLGQSLEFLQLFADAKVLISSSDSKTPEEKAAEIETLSIRDSTVSDLVLDFLLPGTDIELKDGGKNILVDINNVEEYVELVIDWTLRRGIMLQLKEFKSGFSSVFPVRDLQSFTPSELVMMTSAIDEDWSVECLTNCTKADHGFTMDSRPVRDVLGIMSELTLEERREFLSFITGSPRLPIGGFASLSPTLTIVRKDGGDGSLPSVMTCVNYIKLPDYSSRIIVKERVMTAIREGAAGFHLSELPGVSLPL